MVGLYQELLGAEFERLHPGVRRSLCAPLTAQGVAQVKWGRSPLARLLRMPRPGRDISVKLQVTDTDRGMQWHRQFGDQVFLTHQTSRKGLLVEHIGIAATVLRLERLDDSLRFTSVAGRLLGFSTPLSVSPKVEAVVRGLGDHRWHVNVIVTARRALVCEYDAVIEAV